MKKLIFVFLSVILISSCSKSSDDTSACSSDITYATKVSTVINKSCAIAGCHISGGGGNGVFSSLAGVKAKVDNGSFKTRTLDKKDMPPLGSSALTAEELEILTCWLSNGAK